ncbi:FG-GAP repeat domain-containing protein [Pseudarcicella hirudinis]|uniref:FG-GAP repeat domain-containing protein n=1 Tax=Pseudarcicella hirudinis TaxID=1079859 RepID=UPI0035EAE25F
MSRDEALNQVFSLRRKFTSYLSYADASMKEILTPEQFKMADTLIAETFASVVLENKGDGTFINHPLPIEAQFAPVFGIALLDVNHDGLKDLVLGGNQTYTRIKIGKMDANYGMLFLNKGKFSFEYVPQSLSGFNIRGDVRDIVVIPQQGETRIYFGRNNKSVAEYILKK